MFKVTSGDKKKSGGRIRLLISLLQSYPLEAIVVWYKKMRRVAPLEYSRFV